MATKDICTVEQIDNSTDITNIIIDESGNLRKVNLKKAVNNFTPPQEKIEQIQQNTNDIAWIRGDISDLKTQVSSLSEENTELKSDLTELSESINDISYDRFPFNLIKNSYVALDGSIIPYDGWSRTDYIDCQNWGKLLIHSDGTHNVYNCFYDSNHTFITTFTIENGDNTIQIPPNTKYFILSGSDENMDVTYITSKLRKDLDDAKTSLNDIENEVVKIVHNIKQSIVAYNAYWINVPIEKDVSYTIINNSDGTIDLSTYTEDKSTSIESLTTMSPNSNYTFTANNDAYYLLMYPSANGEIEIIDNSTELEKIKADIGSLLTIGVGTEYPTIKEGFEKAIKRNKGVIIKPGTYDLVSEGISGIGYILPKKVIGYGAILRCDLPEENWTLSPLNCDYTSPLDVEVYGLTVICSNCRYNIHDDMGAMARGAYYRHVFKDLTLVHNSAPSSVLINPNNIGGGFGDMGEILIENCIMESQSNVNSDYHSSFAEVQTKGCKATFKDCVLNKTVTSASLGSDTSYMNKVYVTNCLCGTVPVNVTYPNNSLIGWNNVQS